MIFVNANSEYNKKICVHKIIDLRTFRMLKHLAVSVNPTISSGVHTLRNGKSDFLAISAAKAVFPAFGAPTQCFPYCTLLVVNIK